MHAYLRLAALLLFCCAGAAQAQFVWIAPNGTRMYSDQPPPPGTPAAKILKAPGRPAAPMTEPAGAPAAPGAVKSTRPTLAERELAFSKRAKDREDAARKADDAAQEAAIQKAFCEGTRKVKRTYESGMRIADVGEDGKQRFITDSERAERLANMNKALKDCR
jgi:hypothetical protein